MAKARLTEEERLARKAASAKKWYDKNRHRWSEYRLRSKYGLSEDQYASLLGAQGGCCNICGTTEPGCKGRFNIDHCHASGVVRGLLCHHCNTALGLFKDNETTILAAAAYLKRAREGAPKCQKIT